MNELENIKNENNPDEVLLLVDASSGQDAVNVAQAFNEKIGITGVVMSKMDGDARGGAALSIKHMTGVPIKLSGVGEKLTDLDIFHPDRMADRILGMGDVLTLVEKAQQEFDEKEAKKSVNKMLSGKFDLTDMIAQMKQVRKLGSLGGLLKLIPGMPKISAEQTEAAEREMKNMEVLVNSMTPEERKNPDILKYSRKIRIANGSGKSVAELNRMLKKYEQMRETMKMMEQYRKSGKMPPGGLGGLGGLGGGFGGF
jgi:signal recognition particle subunit SRP54